MKIIILSIIGIGLMGFNNYINAQQTIADTMMHDGETRSYIIYIPANYTGNAPVPLLFNFHGRTGTATQQMNWCDFRPIADTAGFIIVHPQGLLFNGVTCWNVGGEGFTLGMTTDDIGFTEAMIDTIAGQYNIDLTRVYSTGYSNGGFFSFELACQLGYNIAAIASVGGSMTPETLANCNPQHPTPVLQIHGTDDTIVPYDGVSWSEPVTTAISYWVNYNNTASIPIVTVVPDINTSDSSTVEHYIYQNGDSCTSVEHYKVIDGGHDWPGSWGNMDINSSSLIWSFVSQYDINGKIGSAPIGMNENISELILFQVFPNPSNGQFTIFLPDDNTELIITDMLGRQIINTRTSENTVNLQIDTKGVYLVYIRTKQGITTRKLIINK